MINSDHCTLPCRAVIIQESYRNHVAVFKCPAVIEIKIIIIVIIIVIIILII